MKIIIRSTTEKKWQGRGAGGQMIGFGPGGLCQRLYVAQV